MPRAQGSKDYISLAKGLVTEASPLAFPEGATTDEQNFILDLDGMTRSRRRGLAPVKTEQVKTFGPDVQARLQEVMYWNAPNLILFVYDKIGSSFGTYITLHRNDLNMTEIGEYELSTDSEQVFLAQSTDFIAITVGDGSLPYLLEYKESANEVQLSQITLYVRDFELVDDSLDLTTRPVTLTDNHEYNLFNAGWYAERREGGVAGVPLGNPVTFVFNDIAKYPSNADVASLGIRFDAANDFDVFDVNVFGTLVVGNTEAPRGHYIYPLNNFDRTDKLTNKEIDGAPGSTLTTLTTWSI